jgi:hypothetical protein
MHPLKRSVLCWLCVAALIGLGCLLAARACEGTARRGAGAPLPLAGAADSEERENERIRKAAQELLGAKKAAVLTKKELEERARALALKPAIQTLDLGALWKDKRWRIAPASKVKANPPYGLMTGVRTRVRKRDGKGAGTSLTVCLFTSGTAATRYLWILGTTYVTKPGYQPPKFGGAGDVGFQLSASSVYFVRRNVFVSVAGKGVDVTALAKAVDKLVIDAAKNCHKFTIKTPAQKAPKD